MVWPRRAWFHQAGQCGVRRGDGDVHDQSVVSRHLCEHDEIAHNQARLGDDPDGVTGAPGEDLQDGARDTRTPLDRLVGVRGCANGDLGSWVEPAQLLFKQPRRVLLQVDLVLEGGGPALPRLRSSRELFRRQSTFFEVVLASYLPELRSRALPCPRGGLSSAVRRQGFCRAQIPEGDGRARRQSVS
jgi:hypothetical protein